MEAALAVGALVGVRAEEVPQALDEGGWQAETMAPAAAEDLQTFLRALRQKDLPLGSTPVLMASTEIKAQDKDAARNAGANFYLSKPVSQDELALYAKMLAGAAP